MNEEWKDWVKLNLERGCSVTKMKALLLESGFLMNEIELEINAVVNNKSVGIDYHKLSDVLLVRNKLAKKIKNNALQMYVFDDFLDAQTCNKIIAQINLNLRPSPLPANVQDHYYRTSRTCDLGLLDEPILHEVDKKISNTLGITLSWSEPMQGQRYDVGQEFKVHADYFEPNTKVFEEFALVRGQRTWTFMVYLNDVKQGGETYFSKIDKVFHPKMGQAVIWNNLMPDGSPNTYTSHCGQPVTAGSKFIITKWFRDKGEGTPFI